MIIRTLKPPQAAYAVEEAVGSLAPLYVMRLVPLWPWVNKMLNSSYLAALISISPFE